MFRQKHNNVTDALIHYSPIDGNQPTQNGDEHNQNIDQQYGNRKGSHYHSHHRHHGKSNDYHHGYNTSPSASK